MMTTVEEIVNVQHQTDGLDNLSIQEQVRIFSGFPKVWNGFCLLREIIWMEQKKKH